MSPRSHAAADLAVLSLATLLIAPAAVALLPLGSVVLRFALGGYAPGPWAWMTIPFAATGAITLAAVATWPPTLALALLWPAAVGALALTQMADGRASGSSGVAGWTSGYRIARACKRLEVSEANGS